MNAFLGTGLLGSNFVKAMLKRREEVNVWNRTTSKAKELEQFGAKAFDNAADAVKNADIIHLTLKDDASVDEVLQQASKGFKAGVIIVDHTTTSKEGAIQRTNHWKERGFFYQHAPVFMGPANALESSGFILLSGDEELTKKIQPHLSKMTGKILHFGNEVGKAAAMKLAGNCFLECFTVGLRDTLCLSKALNISTDDLFNLFDQWNPTTILQPRLKRMVSGDYSDPSWELNMARKDAGLFLQATQNSQPGLVAIPALTKLMDEWINKGFGNSDWTVIAKDCL